MSCGAALRHLGVLSNGGCDKSHSARRKIESRDQETDLATEAVFLDGGNHQMLAQVVRKGTGKALENDAPVMTANDVKGVMDGWAQDLGKSYLQLKSQ
ncbi:Protein of unknown function [Pseudomonas sp. ok272]|nr:Protein of unknown function [Pseudomonas sp. ok272]SFM17625.1 Protein of unknown function [Pseudomonas sp. ok602]